MTALPDEVSAVPDDDAARVDRQDGPTRREVSESVTSWTARLAAVGVPTAVLIAHTTLYGQWIEDDAGLTFAYARSISNGLGPVLQPGAPPVEGWSNPLWLAVMVAGRAVGLFDHGTWLGLPDLVAFPKVVALLCGIATFVVMFVLAKAVSPRPVIVTMAAGVATALVPSFVIWSTSGLENSLFALLVVALAVVSARAAVQGRLTRRRVAVACGLLAAAAALTRPDGIVYVLVHPLLGLVLTPPERRQAAFRAVGHGLAAFALPVGVYGIWRLATFGDWLPTTARAKQQGLPGLTDLNRPGELVSYGGWLAVVVVTVAVVLVARERSAARTATGALLVPLALAALAFAVLEPDWMSQFRFATPVWPLTALVGAIALDQVLGGGTARVRATVGLMAVLAVVASTSGFIVQAKNFHDDTTAPMCFVAQSVGQRVDDYADILGIAEGSLLAVDGGGTSLSTRMRFVDLSGLTDPPIARAWQTGDVAGLREYVFEDVRPTFIKSDRSWGGGAALLADPRFQRDYEVIFSLGAGSGTWVRRDAVAFPARLVVARRWAPLAYAAVEQPYLRPEEQTQWRCGPGLTTSSPSPYPLPS